MSDRSLRAPSQRSTRSRDEGDEVSSSRTPSRRRRTDAAHSDAAAAAPDDHFAFTGADDGQDGARQSTGRGSRRSARQPYSLTQPAPTSSSSSRNRASTSDGDDSIDFLDGDDAEADPPLHSTDLLHPSASAPSSNRSTATSPVDPNSVELAQGAQDWLRPLTELTDRRHPREPLDHQSKKERILVRSMLHTLITHTRKDQEILNEDDGIRRAIKLADQVNRAVLQVTEELQDAEEMQALASKGHEKARKQLQSDKSFDLGVYLDALCEQYRVEDKLEDSHEIDWVRLGHDCEKLAYTARITSFMRGAYFHQTAAKAKRARRERVEEELKATSATAVTSDEGLVAKQTQVRQAYVQQRIKQLTRLKPVMVWRLLLDPTSFVRSVENFFDFSFAVKAGVVRFSFREWDKQMAFPLVQWRATEGERTKQRKAMKALVQRIGRKLERSSQGLQEEEEEGEAREGQGGLSQREREDLAAERRARRARKETKMRRVLEQLKALDSEDREARTAEAKAAIAQRKVQAKQDAEPHNFGHFTPTLDHPTWTGMVIKLHLTRPLIPPMTEEDQRVWAQKLSHRHPTHDEGKRNHIDVDGGDDEGEKEAQGDEEEHKGGGDEGVREGREEEEEEEVKEPPAEDDEIEFMDEA